MGSLKKIIFGFTLITFLLIFSAGRTMAQLSDSTEFFYKKYGRCWFGKVHRHLEPESDTTGSGNQPLHKKDEDEDDGRTYIIPVVFHIIHSGGNENIPDDYIYRQIDDLNRDFSTPGTYKGDPAGVDTKIRFCLAKAAPDGTPSTGIIRVRSSATAHKTDGENEMITKNLSRWDPERYLNFWVVKNIDGNDSISGYSYLASEAAGKNFDGVVLNFRFVGSNNRYRPIHYNLGKTATHEVGHFLQLLHPWGRDGQNQGGCNDDDGVEDTPICSGLYFAGPPLCLEPEQCGNIIRMTANHMDYSKDRCATVFTEGQAARMRSALRKYRFPLISYPNMLLIQCDSLYNIQNPVTENKLEVHPNPANSVVNLFPRFKSMQELEILIYDNMGRRVKHITGLKGFKERIQVHLPDLRPGLYHFIINTEDAVLQKKVVILGGE